MVPVAREPILLPHSFRLSLDEAKRQARAIPVLASDLKHDKGVVDISATLDDKTLGGVLSHVCFNSGLDGCVALCCALLLLRVFACLLLMWRGFPRGVPGIAVVLVFALLT